MNSARLADHAAFGETFTALRTLGRDLPRLTRPALGACGGRFQPEVTETSDHSQLDGRVEVAELIARSNAKEAQRPVVLGLSRQRDRLCQLFRCTKGLPRPGLEAHEALQPVTILELDRPSGPDPAR